MVCAVRLCLPGTAQNVLCRAAVTVQRETWLKRKRYLIVAAFQGIFIQKKEVNMETVSKLCDSRRAFFGMWNCVKTKTKNTTHDHQRNVYLLLGFKHPEEFNAN